MVYEVLPSRLKSDVVDNFDSLLSCTKSNYCAVRHMAARTIAASACSMTLEIMNMVLDGVLPLLGASHETSWRQGAVETIYRIL